MIGSGKDTLAFAVKPEGVRVKGFVVSTLEAHVVSHIQGDRRDLNLAFLHLLLKDFKIGFAYETAEGRVVVELLVAVSEVQPSLTGDALVCEVDASLTPSGLVHLPRSEGFSVVPLGVVIEVRLNDSNPVNEVLRDDGLRLKATATD